MGLGNERVFKWSCDPGHMTKMAAMHIYAKKKKKKLKKYSSLEPKGR